MSVKGKRLDVLLEEGGYFPSRQTARTAIMDGAILVNGVKVTKPGQHIKDGAKIEITSQAQKPRYVSRGGFKLEKALQHFSVDVKDKVCLDVGASTGGFTDCLLQHGATFVFAVDVGYGQLAWSLRTDDRVKVFERWNARTLAPEKLLADTQFALPTIAVIDVSFISLEKILPAVIGCLNKSTEAQVIALVKPQFEAGKAEVGKGGVVKEASTHKLVLLRVIEAATKIGLSCVGLSYSPIKGPEGNIEFLLDMRIPAQGDKAEYQCLSDDLVDSLVEEAHQQLNRTSG
ncbi:MAG: TlyA family RNA methyltransferase [Candidatus Obscuribacterales bacterium]|jgi:23S rRNA (cytidine1920-2'-O)/16S rRNA (cytidine1409-2'-O)-methyltransferase|nr:TlyA family RNA methyltransferase [Candidatus Obscuribacterales bacterium]